MDGQTYLFTVGATPFNDQSVYQLCKDKEFFYNYYQDVVAMPQKKGFLDPNCEPEYRDYLKFKTLEKIIQETSLSRNGDLMCITGDCDRIIGVKNVTSNMTGEDNHEHTPRKPK